MLFRLSNSLFVAAFLVLFAVSSAGAEPRIGLWVEVEGTNRPFRSKADFDEFQAFTENEQFTDLYCQIYRGGRSWFPSMVADDEPYRKALKDGFDPLGDTLKTAHARGQRVHAWINILRIWNNRDAPMFHVVGRKAALVDNYGKSILDYDALGAPPHAGSKYFKLGTPGLWLEAGVPAVRQYLLATIEDLLRAYPDLDGIHLDMVRYPFAVHVNPPPSGKRLDFGYSDDSLERFYASEARSVNGLETTERQKISRVMRPLPSGPRWDAWRREQVTSLVAEVRQLLRQKAPHMELSAAVIAWRDRAYNRAFQDWHNWIDIGLVEEVLPMAYASDSAVVRRLSKNAFEAVGSDRVMVGLGAWLSVRNHNRLLASVRSVFELGGDQIALFSYSNLLSPSGKTLVDKVFREVETIAPPEPVPVTDRRVVVPVAN